MEQTIKGLIDVMQLALPTTDPHKNIALTQVNDHVIRMSVMTGNFYWHYHPNSDETFYVVEGVLLLDVGQTTLELKAGQMFTVPKNVIHRTRAGSERSVNLTVELTAMETVQVQAP